MEDSELQLMQVGSDALHRFALRPDCFASVGKRVRFQCASLDYNQDERVAAAISMTLCEIRTAKHYSVPLECDSFAPESVETARSEAHNSQGSCVDALSRSAQLWSSYSGYLREIPLLCVAFRRLNDIDIAREIYRNITLEKTGFIRLVKDQRARDQERELRWFTQRENFTDGVLTTVSHFRNLQADLFQRMQESATEMDKQHTNIVRSLVRDLEFKHSELLAQSSVALDQITLRHSAEIAQVVKTLEEAFHRQSQLLAGQYQAQQEHMDSLMHYAESRTFEIDQKMNDFLSAMAHLKIEVSFMANETRRIGDGLETIESGHKGLLVVSRDLAFSIRALTSHVQSELQSINETMVSIQQISLQNRVYGYLGASWTSISWMVLVFILTSSSGVMSWAITLLLKAVLLFPLARGIRRLFSENYSGEMKTTFQVSEPRTRQPRKSVLPPRLTRLYSIGESERVSRIPSRLFT